MKKIRGVPLSFPKLTEGGVPNSEKRAVKETKKEKGGKKTEVAMLVLFISEQIKKRQSSGICFWGVFKNTEQLGGSGITVLLSYTAGTFQNHMCLPMYEHEPM